MKARRAIILLGCWLISQLAARPAWAVLDPALQPGTRYYYEVFTPEQKPWQPGRDMNIEEVFKHYEYVEIVYAPGMQTMTVTVIRQGRRREPRRFSIEPDGSLKPQDPH